MIGDKIRSLREELGISQEELAQRIGYDKTYISKIENGRRNLSEDTLLNIKEKLGIPGTPVSDKEIEEFKNELYQWHELIKNRQIDEAKTIQAKLGAAVLHCHEQDLIILYWLFNLKLLYSIGTIDSMEKLLDALSEHEPMFSQEYLYYYYFGFGLYHVMLSQNKEALRYFHEAERLDKELRLFECNLYYTIANLYSRMDCITKTFYYISKAIEISKVNHQTTFDLDLDILLAINYTHIGETEQAQTILLNCLNQAKIANKSLYIGIIYHNLGYIDFLLQDYDSAIHFYMKELEYIDVEGIYFIENLTDRARVLMKQGVDASEYINRAKKLSKNQHELLILVNSLVYSHNLDSAESIDYIESVTIPMLSDSGQYFEAIEYCNMLKKHFISKRSIKKALEYSNLANQFYEIILKGAID